MAIGSREQPGSVRYGEPGYRHLIGRIFNAMVRGLVLPGIQDSQCGFKCFRGDVADAVFPYRPWSGCPLMLKCYSSPARWVTVCVKWRSTGILIPTAE